MIEEMSELPETATHDHLGSRQGDGELARDQPGAEGDTLYFCDPHSPWQRGSNENTNRLLRFWFEKRSDLSVHTKDDLKRIEEKLNKRPRPTLNLETPADRSAHSSPKQQHEPRNWTIDLI